MVRMMLNGITSSTPEISSGTEPSAATWNAASKLGRQPSVRASR